MTSRRRHRTAGASSTGLDSARGTVVEAVDVPVVTPCPQPACGQPLVVPAGIAVVVADAAVVVDVLAVNPGPEVDAGRTRVTGCPGPRISCITAGLTLATGYGCGGTLHPDDERSDAD